MNFKELEQYWKILEKVPKSFFIFLELGMWQGSHIKLNFELPFKKTKNRNFQKLPPPPPFYFYYGQESILFGLLFNEG